MGRGFSHVCSFGRSDGRPIRRQVKIASWKVSGYMNAVPPRFCYSRPMVFYSKIRSARIGWPPRRFGFYSENSKGVSPTVSHRRMRIRLRIRLRWEIIYPLPPLFFSFFFPFLFLSPAFLSMRLPSCSVTFLQVNWWSFEIRLYL